MTLFSSPMYPDIILIPQSIQLDVSLMIKILFLGVFWRKIGLKSYKINIRELKLQYLSDFQ